LSFFGDGSSRDSAYTAAGGSAVAGNRINEIEDHVATLRADAGIRSEFRWSEYCGGAKEDTYTKPDQVTGRGQYVESKAGRFARLSQSQRRANDQPGLNYRVDHLLPQDIGSLFGFLGSQIGYRLPDYDRSDQNPQDQQGQ